MLIGCAEPPRLVVSVRDGPAGMLAEIGAEGYQLAGFPGAGNTRMQVADATGECALYREDRRCYGTEGDVDLANELDGEIFGPLRDPDYFRGFRVHPELHTLIWPNSADFAPEFLYEKTKVKV